MSSTDDKMLRLWLTFQLIDVENIGSIAEEHIKTELGFVPVGYQKITILA